MKQIAFLNALNIMYYFCKFTTEFLLAATFESCEKTNQTLKAQMSDPHKKQNSKTRGSK